MKRAIKLLALLLIAVVAFPLTACGDSGAGDGDGAALTLFINQGNKLEGARRDGVWEKIEEATGTTLTFGGTNHDGDYYTTLNPKIQTLDWPDIFFSVPNATSGAYYTWANPEEEILYNMDDLIAEKPGEYPYIEAVFESEQYKNIMFYDQHTLLPGVSSGSGWGIYYRGDWLVNVGYYETDEGGEPKLDGLGNRIPRTPKTIDEFTEVLYKFTFEDPDGNGAKNTWGISPHSSYFYLNPLYHAFGVPLDYDVKDGEVVYGYSSDEYKNFLDWMRMCYREGYVEPQYNNNGNGGDRNKFYDGEVGVIITNAEQHVTWVVGNTEKQNGAGVVTMGAPPEGVGSFTNANASVTSTATQYVSKNEAGGFSDWGGWWGGLSITKGCKDPHAAMRLLNYLISPEGTMLRTYGIENVHYSLDDNGNVIYTSENLTNRQAERSGRFSSVEVADGQTQLIGAYTLSGFGGALWDWSDYNLADGTGTIGVTVDAKLLDAKYADYIVDAKSKEKLVSSALSNLTNYSMSVNDRRTRITDLTDTFTLRYVMGQESDYAGYISSLNSNMLEQVKTSLKNTATSMGLIS